MRIKKVTASFGKLQNETLTFHDGLNIVYAPSKSGKSTWCAFIRYMLYGVPVSDSSKSSTLQNRHQYTPSSGAPMEGSMDINADSCDITLIRTTRSASAPMKEFSAVYTGTSETVEGMTGENSGEMLTGIKTYGEYKHASFIRQDSDSENSELQKKIAATLTTGNDSIFYADADSRLRGWIRKRRSGKHGILPDLERRMDAIQRTLSDMDNSSSDASSIELQLQEAKAECSRLEAAMTESRKIQRRNALTRMTDGRTEIDKKVKAHELAVEQLSEARDNLRRSFFSDRNIDELQTSVDGDIKAIDTLSGTVSEKQLFPPILPILFMILAVVFASLYSKYHGFIFIIPSIVSLIAGVYFAIKVLGRKRQISNANAQIRSILQKYHSGSAENISLKLEEHRVLVEAVRIAAENETHARLDKEDAILRQAKIEDAVLGDLDFAEGSSEAARLSRQLAEARNKVIRLSSKLSSINLKTLTYGDSLSLQSELATLEDQHNRYEAELEAMNLAIDTLKDSDIEFRNNFSSEVGELASSYMARMTGGRFRKILIERDFSAMDRTDLDPVTLKSDYLSTGILDLMYFAIRLAECELLMPENDSCPLIIDDAMSNLDDTRLNQALELLRDISKNRQIILFTCRKI